MFGVNFLELDGNFLLGLEVGGLPDFSESTVTEFLGQLIVFVSKC